MENSVSTLWLILATFLVLSMQAGFLMLEGGRVRSKNSINVAQKNITDLVVIWIVFFSVGFLVMFGISIPELINNDSATITVSPIHFIYQMAFCSTAATILSGAVAERMSFRAYLALVALIGAFIYPLVGRMIWGNTYNSEVSAWLSDLGFMDFAGSTVVHSVGAWIGLVCILTIGPRIGRFNRAGEVQAMPAHNAVVALFGLFVLMLGWLGFNGGSVSPSDPLLVLILFNTLTAGVFGGAVGMLIGAKFDNGVFNPTRVTSGLLGGLVAITACVNVVSAYEAMVVGMLGGAVATAGAHLLLHKFKFDDPLDVVATHGFAGVVGTLSIPFVAPLSALNAGSRLAQFAVQAGGVIAVFVFTSASAWIMLSTLGRFIPLRVSREAEEIGLNYTEHGESIGLDRLQNTLNSKIIANESFADGIVIDSDDEHSELAAALNRVIGKYEQSADELHKASLRFRQFAETASDWLWETDAELKLNFIHANSKDTQGILVENLLGKHLLDTLRLTANVNSVVQRLINEGKATPVFEAVMVLGDDLSEPISVEVRGVPSHNEKGELIGYRGTITDISIRKSAESKALFLSVHDELTGLPNRRSLASDLQTFTQRSAKNGKSVVVAAVDLDGFKAVNDAYGHQIGDALLIKVTERLVKFLRPADSAYRTGGDEFVVLIDDLGSGCAAPNRVAAAISERIIAEISRVYHIQSLEIQVGASIGLATYPQHTSDVNELQRMADLALYAAKDAGKGCVVCFKDELEVDAKLQLELEQDLKRALTNNEFYLMYQPQVNTVSEVVTGYEALIRWRHPERGEMQPADFIMVAEKLNLMDEIGSFVLDEACRFASSWETNNDGNELQISVNVSPLQFKNINFIHTVKDTLARHSLAPTRLALEITEDLLVHDFAAVSDILQELKALGVSIAVDDFGSGQTSLRYLDQFPLSTIKIDRSFIQQLTNNANASEITRTIVMLGQKLGINVLAEGVEEADQLKLLREWQCDQIQGFLFSEPMTQEAVVEQLSLTDDSSGTDKAA